MYTILFKGLPEGSHTFDWTIGQSFFAEYEMSEISDAHIDVQVILVKHHSFLELDFVFDGWAEVSCDRCLDPVKLKISSDARMYVKFGNSEALSEEESDDIVMLPYHEDRFNIAQYIYEYVHLSLPVRRVHPDNEQGINTCNREMIGKLEQFLIKEN